MFDTTWNQLTQSGGNRIVEVKGTESTLVVPVADQCRDVYASCCCVRNEELTRRRFSTQIQGGWKVQVRLWDSRDDLTRSMTVR